MITKEITALFRPQFVIVVSNNAKGSTGQNGFQPLKPLSKKIRRFILISIIPQQEGSLLFNLTAVSSHPDGLHTAHDLESCPLFVPEPFGSRLSFHSCLTLS